MKPLPFPEAQFECSYFAVVFSSVSQNESSVLPSEYFSENENENDSEMDYQSTSQKMIELAQSTEGFLGVESVRDESSHGITVSYWKSLEAIGRWKEQTDHKLAQKFGKERWYSRYRVRICEVIRDY